jgi:predicted transposase YbfD/YdcC
MDSSCPEFDVNMASDGFVIDVHSLYAWLGKLPDKRDARGLRYSLVTVLVLIVLAKLAGEDRPNGIAEWVKHRAAFLAEALHWKKVVAPHRSTYSRILGWAVDVAEFERTVSAFFAAQPKAGRSIVVALDGKTLRGSILAGETHGLHLLAAYLCDEGWVLMQVAVGSQENEISAAPRVLGSLDLRGKVVTGDALLAQRELSVQVVNGGGDYLWAVKGNQETLAEDIAAHFELAPLAKGCCPAPVPFPTARSVDKGHGRLECRTIRVSSALRGYLEWPYAEQVFKLERHTRRLKDGKETSQIVYGITSLTAEEASPQRLLALVRKHWQIENGLHYRRDETLREDWCHLRIGHAQQVMAIINNLVLGLLLRGRRKNVPQARRFYAAHPEKAIRLISHP